MSSSPEKKRRKMNEPSLTSLPNDLLLNCLARVSRIYYPTLSLVSKSFRSLLTSPELYKFRSVLGNTENCLYVCINTYSDLNPSWYTLCRIPHQTLTNEYHTSNKSKKMKKSSGYVLAKVPISGPHPAKVPGLVTVGSSIYNIKRSSVSILDCTSHTWHEGPSLPVELWSYSVSVLDEKIYVAGCYKDKDDGSLKSTVQVLDTKTLIWDPMSIPSSKAYKLVLCKSAFIDGKFHVKTGKGKMIAYNSKEGRWDMVGESMGDFMCSYNPYCVIGNVLYAASYRDLIWYDTDVRQWRKLKGLVGLPEFSYGNRVRLADYCGKMVVLWYEDTSSGPSKKIWCAEITLEKRRFGEIWGEVEWFDHVLTLQDSCYFMKGLTVTV